MENNKKQAGGGEGGGASHGSLDHLFGPKDSSSASSSSLFGSIFPPVPSTGTGRERKQEFGSQGIGSSGKYGSPSIVDNKSTTQGYYSSRGESMNQNEGAEPCNFSSSIYYGGQENYSPRTGTTDQYHQPHIFKKDGGEDDANGINSNGASRGNWWQGSLYY